MTVHHKPTQNERIIQYIKDFGSITQLDALRDLGVMRLASRISDLKRLGYPVISTVETVKNRYGERAESSAIRWRKGASQKMDVRFEKAWKQLRKQDREVIERVKAREVEELAFEKERRDLAIVQKRWLKALCIVLNKNKGYGRKRLLLVLGWWKEMYRIISTKATNEELDAYLDSETDRIFGKGGYPSKYIDKLEEL